MLVLNPTATKLGKQHWMFLSSIDKTGVRQPVAGTCLVS